MIDVVLLFGKLLLLALMYLFLFAAVRAGLAGVRGVAPRPSVAGGLALVVTRGPRELLGVNVPLHGRVVIGRAPDADVVIPDDFVSTHHAAVTSANGAHVLEDLGSTNGTEVNGRTIEAPVKLSPGDVVEVGRVAMEVRRS